MDTATTEPGTVTPNSAESGGGEESVSISKREYETLNQTLGSLKRELKDLKKTKEDTKETPSDKKDANTEGDALLSKIEKIAFRTAGITHDEDKELARKTAKKWNMDIDEVLDDEDFQDKLEKQRTARDNANATSNIKGDGNGTSAKESTAYWQAKGVRPTPDQVPDRKARVKIIREMMGTAKTGGKKFYND